MFASILLAFLACSYQPVWNVGASRVEITPKEPVWMAGYASRAKPASGKSSELYARGLALKDGAGNSGVIITLDLVGIDAKTSAGWSAAISKEFKLPRKAIVFACSHTHCGPVVGSTLEDMYPLSEADRQASARYQVFLVDQVLRAARLALANLAPATLSWHKGTCGFAVNRRNNPEAEVEKRRAMGSLVGPVDHSVPVLVARDPSGKMRAILFGYACHATTMGFQDWYGDWPGEACSALEKDLVRERGDSEAVALFVAGCGADQNPLPRRRLELAKAYGTQLALSVQAAIGQSGVPVRGKLGMALEKVELPLEAPPGRDALLDQKNSKEKAVASRAKRLLDSLDKGDPLPTRYPAPVQAWAIGDVHGVIFLPGEVVVDYSLRFSKELKGRSWWVASYTNDVMAYIPSKRIRIEGGYEGEKAMVYYGLPAPWREQVEQVLADGVKKIADMAMVSE